MQHDVFLKELSQLWPSFAVTHLQPAEFGTTLNGWYFHVFYILGPQYSEYYKNSTNLT